MWFSLDLFILSESRQTIELAADPVEPERVGWMENKNKLIFINQLNYTGVG